MLSNQILRGSAPIFDCKAGLRTSLRRNHGYTTATQESQVRRKHRRSRYTTYDATSQRAMARPSNVSPSGRSTMIAHTQGARAHRRLGHEVPLAPSLSADEPCTSRNKVMRQRAISLSALLYPFFILCACVDGGSDPSPRARFP